MTTIEAALDAASDHNMRQLHYSAIPIAKMARWFLAGQGCKPLPDELDFNPFGAVIVTKDAKAEIPEELARLVLELSGENKIPGWAIAELDVEKIRKAAS